MRQWALRRFVMEWIISWIGEDGEVNVGSREHIFVEAGNESQAGDCRHL